MFSGNFGYADFNYKKKEPWFGIINLFLYGLSKIKGDNRTAKTDDLELNSLWGKKSKR
jgi:hypothetical protein